MELLGCIKLHNIHAVALGRKVQDVSLCMAENANHYFPPDLDQKAEGCKESALGVSS